jgi:IS30 family transposase
LPNFSSESEHLLQLRNEKNKKFSHLSKGERNEIYLLKQKGYSFRNIAKALGRSVSSISDELKRNTVDGEYDAKKASHKAYVRRKESKYQGMKIVANVEIQHFVDKKLLDDQSPSAIAGRITTQESFDTSVSKDSIYRYIKSVYGRKIEVYRLKKKQRRKKRIVIHPMLQDRTFIDKRPNDINTRKRYGDLEADFVVSGKGGSGILLVVVDRKSRLVFLRLLRVVKIENVHKALIEIQKRYPYIKSMTLDNDILFRKHKELSSLLDVPLYFCHPYHSWEKGTVENVNKYIRRDIPKGRDLSKYSDEQIHLIEEKLNRRPMKCLNYKTPSEVTREYVKQKNLPRGEK